VDTAVIYIDGGGSKKPEQIDFLSLVFCTKTKSVAAHIAQIPNEPISFKGDWRRKSRTEDAIIAYTWSHFVNDTSLPYWILRLPMTKAVVRALDTVQDFTAKLPHVPKINNFVVSGASKRGWTTWTTGIVDKRVIAIIPIVIPILNLVPTINVMFRVYGECSFALYDYLDMGVMVYINKPEFVKLGAIEDPFSYNQRLGKIPKYVICAAGDEFFLPDSTKYFFNDLQGTKFLRIVPNAEHSLVPQQLDIAIAVGTWYHMIIHNKPMPKFSWTLIRSNGTTAQIIVNAIDKPTGVYMWVATTLSSTKRDFRLFTCDDPNHCFNPVIWFSTELKNQGNGTYVAIVDRPTVGWTGFFVEILYKQSNNPVDPEATLKFTTEVNVVPDIYPFPPCGDHCQPKNINH